MWDRILEVPGNFHIYISMFDDVNCRVFSRLILVYMKFVNYPEEK